MGAVLFQLVLLVAGMGLVEIGLGDAVVRGSLVGWGLVLFVGLPLVLGGTAGFIGPLVGTGRTRGEEEDARGS